MFESFYFYLFVVFAAIQFLYLLFFSKLLVQSNKSKESQQPKTLSVILYARHNEEDLRNNLESILKQDYKKFEVIVVDNDSNDETVEFLTKLQKKHSHLRIVPVENNEAFWANKKYALTLGIKASKYNYVVLTTPDSKPESDQWLSMIASEFSEKKKLILGISKPNGKGLFSNLIVRYDAFINTLFSFGWAGFGKPVVASDSNFAFEKNEFYRVKGFITHVRNDVSMASLFVKDAISNHNLGFTIEEETFVNESKKLSFSEWSAKKKKNLAALSFAAFSVRSSYYFYFLSKILFFALGIVNLFYSFKMESYWIIGNYFFLWMLIFIILLKKFKDLSISYTLPLLDLLFTINEISNFIVYFISKKKY